VELEASTNEKEAVMSSNVTRTLVRLRLTSFEAPRFEWWEFGSMRDLVDTVTERIRRGEVVRPPSGELSFIAVFSAGELAMCTTRLAYLHGRLEREPLREEPARVTDVGPYGSVRRFL